MSLDSAIARAADAELSLWRSVCTITRPAPAGDIFDVAQGAYATPPQEEIYSGTCQVRPLRQDRDAEASFGEAEVAVGDYLVKVPLETDVHRGDMLTVTSSHDPAVFGRTLLVKDVPYSEWMPVRRLVCEELRT